MGEVIRKTAAVRDILSDLRSTLANAGAKGGAWKAFADERLSNLLKLMDANAAQIQEAEDQLLPLGAAIDARDEDADRLLGRVSDMIWNAVGRPGTDPSLATLFPGGVSYYATGSTDEQPHRMELLAMLLEAGTHPKLPTDTAKAFAEEVRQSAGELRAAVEAASVPKARLHQLEQVQKALARSGQVELSNLKRRYKAENFSEADIHTVIPDRPRAATKPASPQSPSNPSS